MDVSQRPHRALGSLRSTRDLAEVCGLRVSHRLVVGCGESGQVGITLVGLTRRDTLILGAGALAGVAGLATRAAAETEVHGISAFGDLKYPPDFHHFEYVDPAAPKGGVFSETVTS